MWQADHTPLDIVLLDTKQQPQRPWLTTSPEGTTQKQDPPATPKPRRRLEKRLARYPQFYSRIGFLHEFFPLSEAEMRFIFEKHWQTLGAKFDSDTFADVEAMNTAIRIIRGNFRLIDRLFSQIRRIMAINHTERITAELVEAARDCLVIGAQ